MAKVTKYPARRGHEILAEGAVTFSARGADAPGGAEYSPGVSYHDATGKYRSLRLHLSADEARELHRWLGAALERHQAAP